MAPYYLRTHRNRSHRRGASDGLPFISDECLIEMVKKETHHLPLDGYLGKFHSGDLDVRARTEAVDWIKKVCIGLDSKIFEVYFFCSSLIKA